tara:strand:- start:483 stop:797 length:315 start_codon:yes stop_codon:yes gene_type:complete
VIISVQGLKKLGFESEIDFKLQDNSDGKGTFIAEWNSDSPQPTNSAIETAHNEWKAEYDSQEYARKRKAEYDQLNQFEMQFDDKKNSTTTWVDKINEIKGRHPK